MQTTNLDRPSFMIELSIDERSELVTKSSTLLVLASTKFSKFDGRYRICEYVCDYLNNTSLEPFVLKVDSIIFDFMTEFNSERFILKCEHEQMLFVCKTVSERLEISE